MITKLMKLAEIRPAEYNPRVTLQEGDTEYKALKNSIDRFGLVEPLIVNERDNTIIGGHQRYNVLKANGVEETEVILVDLDEQQEKTLNISLNKIEGDWDTYKLEAVLKEIDKGDISFTGFSEEEIANIIGLNSEEKIEEIIDEPNSYDATIDNETGEKEEHEFDIYMSFPNKVMAEEFLNKERINVEINDRLRSAVVRMEDYGC